MRGIGRTSAKQLQAELGGARGPGGRLLCTWCKTEVPKGRRTWCSDECVSSYRAVNDWNTIRKAVQRRDKGICAICYTDTKVLKRQFQQVKKSVGRTKALEFAARFGISPKRV